MRKTKWRMMTLAAGIAVTSGAANGAFAPGNLVVLRVGDGASALTLGSEPLFLDEYNASTGALVASHAIPSTGAGALTLGGRNDAHDGHLNLSSNGQYILFGGYRSIDGATYTPDSINSGTNDPALESAASVSRVIGRVDSLWNVDTTTALNDAYDHTNITAVASDDGTRFWTAGSGDYLDGLTEIATTTGGLRYVPTLGSNDSINISQTQTIGGALEPDSLRNTRIVDGQLYAITASQHSFGNRGAYATSVPLPTPGADTPIPLVPELINKEGSNTDFGGNLTSGGSSGKLYPKSDILLLDLDPSVPGFDTAYTTGGKKDYQKWALVNPTSNTYPDDHREDWRVVSSLSLSNDEINALDASVVDGVVTLFASTDRGIFRLIDTGGYNAPISSPFGASYFISTPVEPQIVDGTLYSYTDFRGLVLLPLPEPTSFTLLMIGTLALNRRRQR
ncbi:MAG: hypothetical protein IT444_06240 [Phycisphaeraceae bacterium]|nr:hypothetical protein [Phycisphaeraceae bacterium]